MPCEVSSSGAREIGIIAIDLLAITIFTVIAIILGITTYRRTIE